MRWLAWAVLALLGWGIWGFAAALASQQPGATALGVAAGAVAVELVALSWALPWSPSSMSPWVILAGAAGAVAYVGMFQAFRSNGPAGGVVMVTALYPAVTVALLTVHGEPWNWRRAGALVLTVGAIALAR